MTLHEAMIVAIKHFGYGKQHIRDITEYINKNHLYTKKDNSNVSTTQIQARIHRYPHLFSCENGFVWLIEENQIEEIKLSTLKQNEMADRCKNCGKFISKGTTTCNYCGEQNSIGVTKQDSKEDKIKGNTSLRIKCPNCGSQLTLSKKMQNDNHLYCNNCNQKFANPLKLFGKIENYLRKFGCLTAIVMIALISFIDYFSSEGIEIKADGTTVYIITNNIHAPSTEETAKAMTKFLAQNSTNSNAYTEFVYDNEARFTHVFENDRVVVLKRISTGYLIKKIRDGQTAVIPNANYLKE